MVVSFQVPLTLHAEGIDSRANAPPCGHAWARVYERNITPGAIAYNTRAGSDWDEEGIYATARGVSREHEILAELLFPFPLLSLCSFSGRLLSLPANVSYPFAGAYSHKRVFVSIVECCCYWCLSLLASLLLFFDAAVIPSDGTGF